MMKNIKKFFTSKVTLAVLACLLLVGVFAGITVLATENTPALELTGVGINHDATPSIKYDVNITGLSGAITDNLDRYEMRFWGYEPKDVNDAGYTDTASVANNRAFFGEYADGAQTVSFLSKGFAPKEMTDTIFAAAVYVDEDGNVAAATAIKRYSIFEYICEAGLSGDADQKALNAALKDYITYAQQYLGYEDGTSPSELGYLKVTDAKFWVVEFNNETKKYEKVSDIAYTSGTFLIGTNFWIEADYESAVFKRVDKGWYTKPQTSATGRNDVYISDVTANDPVRHYQAIPTSYTTFNYNESYELLAMTGKIIDKDYSYSRSNATPIANGATAITSKYIAEDRYALVANLFDENGVIFSHWEDAEGNVLGTLDPVLDVTPFIGEEPVQTLDLTGITAVYAETTADRNTSFSTITGGGDYDIPSVGENGELIFDSTSRPTTNPGGKAAAMVGTTTGDKPETTSQIVWSFDFEIAANNDNADGKWTMTDFFTTKDNPCAYQIRPSVALDSHEAALCYFQFYAKKDDNNNVIGWFVNVANGSNNAKAMNFDNAKNIMSVEGKHNITVIFDVETLENGRLVQKGISVYTDGVYAGTAQRTYNDYASINYKNDVAVYWSTLQRTKLCVTLTNMSIKEFI